jgi:hypothetical protein
LTPTGGPRDNGPMNEKHPYEAVGIRPDGDSFTVEILGPQTEGEALALAQHYAALWSSTCASLPRAVQHQQRGMGCRRELRIAAYAIIQALDGTLDESLPLIGRLGEIDRRLAALTPIEFTGRGASENAYCEARRSVIPSAGSPHVRSRQCARSTRQKPCKCLTCC